MKYSNKKEITYSDALAFIPGKTILIAKVTGGGLIQGREYIFENFEDNDLLLSTIYVHTRKNFYRTSKFELPEMELNFDTYEIF